MRQIALQLEDLRGRVRMTVQIVRLMAVAYKARLFVPPHRTPEAKERRV